MLWRPLFIFTLLFWLVSGLMAQWREETSQAQWIVFISTRTEGLNQLYRMSADGSGVRLMTSKRMNLPYGYPKWVDARVAIAYANYQYMRFDILTQQTTLYPPEYVYLSPSGKWLIATYYYTNTDIRTKFVEVAQNETYELPLAFSEFFWSSDEESLLILQRDYQNYTLSMSRLNLNDFTLRPILSGWNIPITSLAPDGKSILFWSQHHYGKWFPLWSPANGNSQIYRLDINEGTLQRLTHSESNDQEAMWSPDGRYISFKRDNDLYIMNADGSGQELVISDMKYCCANWVNTTHLAGYNVNGHPLRVGIASGGEPPLAIHYNERRFRDEWRIWAATIEGQTDLFSQNLRTRQSYQLTNDAATETNYSWSPDGKWVLFESPAPGTTDIYKVRRDGSDLTNLTHHPDWDIQPAWSPIVDRAWHPRHLNTFGVGLVLGVGTLGAGRWRAKSKRRTRPMI